jgi:hypothetical protein
VRRLAAVVLAALLAFPSVSSALEPAPPIQRLPLISHVLYARMFPWLVEVAANCTVAEVQAKINAADSGELVLLPACDVEWSTAVTTPASKNNIIAGSGVGVTIIRRTHAITEAAFVLTASQAAPTARQMGTYSEISGMTIDWVFNDPIRMTAATYVGRTLTDASKDFSTVDSGTHSDADRLRCLAGKGTSSLYSTAEIISKTATTLTNPSSPASKDLGEDSTGAANWLCGVIDAHPSGALALRVDVGSNAGTSFRVYDMEFTDCQRRCVFVNADGIIADGSIDRSDFHSPTDVFNDLGVSQPVAQDNCLTGYTADDAVMSNPIDTGNGPTVYFENNDVFMYRLQDGGYEGYGCARYEVRLNRFHGSSQGQHGTEGQRGTQQSRYYYNDFDISTLYAEHYGDTTGTVDITSANKGLKIRIDGAAGVSLNLTEGTAVSLSTVATNITTLYPSITATVVDGHLKLSVADGHNFTIQSATANSLLGLTVATYGGWSGRIHHIRSGSTQIFGNNYSTAMSAANIQQYIYRAVIESPDIHQPPYGSEGDPNGVDGIADCDGTAKHTTSGSPYLNERPDGNTGSGSTYPAAGYPCLDSPGWWFGEHGGDPAGGGLGVGFLRAPNYTVRNYINDVAGIQIDGTGTLLSATGAPTTHLAENVDFYNEDTTNCVGGGACTLGVGVGTTLPTTCTVNTGFLDTDAGTWNDGSRPDLTTANGVLYRCTTTNNWSVYFSPAAFPNALASGDPLPTLSGISPSFGARNTTAAVTLTGANFDGGNADVDVSGTGITVQSIVVVGPTSITVDFVIAAAATISTRTVTVTTDNGTSGTKDFDVTAASAPVLTLVSPSQAARGQIVAVTLTGTGLSGATVTFSTPGVTAQNVSSTATSVSFQAVVTDSALVGAGTLYVTVAAVNSNEMPFTVLPPPGQGPAGALIGKGGR